MMTRQETKIRSLLVGAIDQAFNDGAFDELRTWYGENHVERMADAALAVLMATVEAQDYMRENNESAI